MKQKNKIYFPIFPTNKCPDQLEFIYRQRSKKLCTESHPPRIDSTALRLKISAFLNRCQSNAFKQYNASTQQDQMYFHRRIFRADSLRFIS